MRIQFPALILTIAALCNAQDDVSVELKGRYIYKKGSFKEGKQCVKWDSQGGGHDTSHMIPHCTKWERSEDDMIYKGEPKNHEAGERSKPEQAPPTPFKGLLREVQETVHTLQAQVAQVQHNHIFKLSTSHEPSGPNQGFPFQKLQLTVNRMQSKLALAKYALHGISSSKNHATTTTPQGKRPGAGRNQGFMYDLQHSVHNVKALLAEIRHSLHSSTGHVEDPGFDQGNLQDMQHTANTLQSQLAKARHALRAHLSARDVLPPLVDEEDFDAEV